MDDENINKRLFNYIIFDITHPSLYLIKTYVIFIKDKVLSLIKKTPDLSSEALHWRRYYHQKSIEHPETAIFKSGKIKKSIKMAVDHFKSDKSKQIDCLDVGCGPTSQFYTPFFNENKRYSIISVDPLAKTYNEIHKRYNSSYDIKCLEGYGEKLHDLFPKKKFHIIYTQNAIDHSQDPPGFIDSCYRVLKPGGLLILHGFIKEGTAANWLGLHKWDIEVQENDLLLSDKTGKIKRHTLTKDYNLTVLHREVTGNKISDMYTFIFKK